MKRLRKLLAVITALALAVSMLGVVTIAEDEETSDVIVETGETTDSVEDVVEDDDLSSQTETVDESETTVEECVVTFGAVDNDALFEAYLEQLFSVNNYAVMPLSDTAGSFLTGIKLDIYNQLREGIESIAAGESSSSRVVINISYSFSDLGVSTYDEALEIVNSQIDSSSTSDILEIFNCVYLDCVYDLYWFDSSLGVVYYPGFIISNEGSSVKIYTYYMFRVASDFQDGSMYVVDTSKVTVAQKAVANAQAIVDKYASKSDKAKLTAYKDEISALVSYDSNYTDYGSVSQLINVFDGDSSTNVVCIGYARAFQYLCDLSSFTDAESIMVTGTLNGGDHAWNVVYLNGINYFVDVTASDTDTEGSANDWRFLLTADDATVSSSKGYTFDTSGHTVYAYDSETLSTYPASYLTLGNRPSYSIAASAPENGTLTVPTSATESDVVTVTATPDEGYEVSKVSVVNASGNEITVTANYDGTYYYFTMPASTVTVSVEFSKVSYAISLSEIENGTVSVDSSAYYLDNVTLTVTADSGYYVDEVTVTDDDNNSITVTDNEDGTYSFTMPASDVTVNVAFARIMYSITVSEAENGSVTADVDTAGEGDAVLLTVSPDEGYVVSSVSVTDDSGNTVEVGSDYSFVMPASNVTVTAEFEVAPEETYAISVGSVNNGTVTVNTESATEGETITVTVTANSGYTVSSVTVTDANGDSVSVSGSDGTYTFTMPASAVTVNAAFTASSLDDDSSTEHTHTYVFGNWVWSSDLNAAYGVFYCNTCGVVAKIPATVSSSYIYGVLTKTATFYYNGAWYSDSKIDTSSVSTTTTTTTTTTTDTTDVATDTIQISEPVEPTDTETEDDGEEEPAAEPAVEAETPAETNPTTGIAISLIPMAIAALAAVSSKRR